tara:strand:- start:199 stop:879 length:681 start_codon:yes stop_codon:yes gene_type:complete
MKEFDYTSGTKNFTSPVFVVNKMFTPEECDNIIKEYDNDSLRVAEHSSYKRELVSKPDIRTSLVSFIQDPEMDARIFHHMYMANYHLCCRYEIHGAENTQFTKYVGEEKGHFTWHQDGQLNHDYIRVPTYGEITNIGQTSHANLGGSVRKISVSIMLNDNFEGGDMQFRYIKHQDGGDYCVDQIDTFVPKKGQGIFFSSDLWHRVTPVTSGDRYSLVKWFAGPPIK